MSQADNNDASSRPVLVGVEEEPDGLNEAWRCLFAAALDTYETLMERRRAKATQDQQGVGGAQTDGAH